MIPPAIPPGCIVYAKREGFWSEIESWGVGYRHKRSGVRVRWSSPLAVVFSRGHHADALAFINWIRGEWDRHAIAVPALEGAPT